MSKTREPHTVVPVPGETGRFHVESATTPGEWYLVDISEHEQTSLGTVCGTCQCKGWSVRKRCSHLDDARQHHADLTDSAVMQLPSGRAYFASKTFLASMDQAGFDAWFEALVERDGLRPSVESGTSHPR
jgi:hypothetical protein